MKLSLRFPLSTSCPRSRHGLAQMLDALVAIDVRYLRSSKIDRAN